ncbi:MAG: hypothetical protein A2V70_19295 [Planctomycetes bacterium RBG_13_63_9]|nr:MAG: hypothetical protein A2V70_19295 [Planctomycetes bacterium RBG_13_63_9]
MPPAGWWPDPCEKVMPPSDGVGTKRASVVVIVYNPVVEAENGRRLTELFRWNDPVGLTRQIIESVRRASGGYVNYHVVKWVDIDGCPPFLSGFRYDDAGIVEAVRQSKWIDGDKASYAKILEEAGVTRRFVEDFNVTEVWLWGAPGFHWDEYAMFIPDRDRRLPPTDNPWFYRPYDIPDLGRTLWVMGWNYERGLDCALESYAHRCEGILALTQGNGQWDPTLSGKDPWNTWSTCGENAAAGIGCGNVHCPPNGQSGYDYGNRRTVTSFCEDWRRWPNATGRLVEIDGTPWNHDHAEYLTWWMAHFPKNPGRTAWGWNNWWIYVANFDGNLADAPNPPKTRETVPR